MVPFPYSGTLLLGERLLSHRNGAELLSLHGAGFHLYKLWPILLKLSS